MHRREFPHRHRSDSLGRAAVLAEIEFAAKARLPLQQRPSTGIGNNRGLATAKVEAAASSSVASSTGWRQDENGSAVGGAQAEHRSGGSRTADTSPLPRRIGADPSPHRAAALDSPVAARSTSRRQATPTPPTPLRRHVDVPTQPEYFATSAVEERSIGDDDDDDDDDTDAAPAACPPPSLVKVLQEYATAAEAAPAHAMRPRQANTPPASADATQQTSPQGKQMGTNGEINKTAAAATTASVPTTRPQLTLSSGLGKRRDARQAYVPTMRRAASLTAFHKPVPEGLEPLRGHVGRACVSVMAAPLQAHQGSRQAAAGLHANLTKLVAQSLRIAADRDAALQRSEQLREGLCERLATAAAEARADAVAARLMELQADETSVRSGLCEAATAGMDALLVATSTTLNTLAAANWQRRQEQSEVDESGARVALRCAEGAALSALVADFAVGARTAMHRPTTSSESQTQRLATPLELIRGVGAATLTTRAAPDLTADDSSSRSSSVATTSDVASNQRHGPSSCARCATAEALREAAERRCALRERDVVKALVAKEQDVDTLRRRLASLEQQLSAGTECGAAVRSGSATSTSSGTSSAIDFGRGSSPAEQQQRGPTPAPAVAPPEAPDAANDIELQAARAEIVKLKRTRNELAAALASVMDSRRGPAPTAGAADESVASVSSSASSAPSVTSSRPRLTSASSARRTPPQVTFLEA